MIKKIKIKTLEPPLSDLEAIVRPTPADHARSVKLCLECLRGGARSAGPTYAMGAEGKDGPVIGGAPDPRIVSDSRLGNAEGNEGKRGRGFGKRNVGIR